jgi:hypothetical protein
MKVKVQTVAYAKGGRETPVSLEVFLDIDEQAIARQLGTRAYRSKRKQAAGMSRAIRATIREIPKPRAAAAK